MGSTPIRIAIIIIQPLLYASVAQLVEQGTENPRVVGSIPTGGTISADLAHLVERHLAKVEVAGSSPVIRSIHGHDHRARFSSNFRSFFSFLQIRNTERGKGSLSPFPSMNMAP